MHPLPSFFKKFSGVLALTLALLPGASAASGDLWATYSLPGTQVKTTWTDLSYINSTLAPSSGTGTIALDSSGFQASAGFYSFSSDYSFTTTASYSGDIANVVFQIDWWPNTDYAVVAPTLSYNGGTQTLAASFSSINGSELRTTSYGTGTYYGYAWQWDLSGISDAITSVTITSPVSVHTSVMGAELQMSNAFTQVVPEPTVGTLVIAALGALLLRRRRTTA